MRLLDVPDELIASVCDDSITYDFNLTVFCNADSVRFSVGDIGTSWMDSNDSFIERIRFDRLNPCFLENHLAKEIEIRNAIDRGCEFLEKEKYRKAIMEFDDALYYDPEYGQALLLKSKALFGQKHFVKSLRHYKKAVRVDESLGDVEYHRLLLKKSSAERDGFPKIKRNIYAGDEYFSKGNYAEALDCYDKALADTTSFKDRILSKLLNKKATALIRLDRIDDAMDVFRKSVDAQPTDYAYYCLGVYAPSLNDYIKRNLKITKKQLLLKSQRLCDFGEFQLALDCLDEFLANHYRVDDDYIKALNLKIDALNGLGEDVGEVELIKSHL